MQCEIRTSKKKQGILRSKNLKNPHDFKYQIVFNDFSILQGGNCNEHSLSQVVLENLDVLASLYGIAFLPFAGGADSHTINLTPVP